MNAAALLSEESLLCDLPGCLPGLRMRLCARQHRHAATTMPISRPTAPAQCIHIHLQSQIQTQQQCCLPQAATLHRTRGAPGRCIAQQVCLTSCTCTSYGSSQCLAHACGCLQCMQLQQQSGRVGVSTPTMMSASAHAWMPPCPSASRRRLRSCRWLGLRSSIFRPPAAKAQHLGVVEVPAR